jgi:hypothetical protein
MDQPTKTELEAWAEHPVTEALETILQERVKWLDANRAQIFYVNQPDKTYHELNRNILQAGETRILLGLLNPVILSDEIQSVIEAAR